LSGRASSGLKSNRLCRKGFSCKCTCRDQADNQAAQQVSDSRSRFEVTQVVQERVVLQGHR
jgi:hypothetical protein